MLVGEKKGTFMRVFRSFQIRFFVVEFGRQILSFRFRMAPLQPDEAYCGLNFKLGCNVKFLKAWKRVLRSSKACNMAATEDSRSSKELSIYVTPKQRGWGPSNWISITKYYGFEI